MLKAWMRRVIERARMSLEPRRSTSSRRHARTRECSVLEGLEGRVLLSTGGVAPFASFPGQITKAGDVAHISISLASGKITSDRSAPVFLGLNAHPVSGSSVSVRITKMDGPYGRLFPGDTRQKDGPFITKMGVPTGQPVTLAVDVAGLDDTVGNFVVDTFLPGDVNGDGKVDATDIKSVHTANGTQTGQTAFNPSADFNGDGRVGTLDLHLAMKNLGARVAGVSQANTSPATPAVVQAAAVTVAPVQPAPVTVAPVQPAPVAVAPIQPAQVATVPVNPSQVMQAPVYGYGQPVILIPLSPSGQPPGTVPVYGYAAPIGAVPIYGYTYGQPVVQAPVVAPAQHT